MIRAMERQHVLPLVLAASVGLAAACLVTTRPAGRSAQPSASATPGKVADPVKSAAAPAEGAIRFEDIAARPSPGTSTPGGFQFTPDDAAITYLFSADASLSQQLYAYDVRSAQVRQVVAPPGGGETEENLSPEEKLRRERSRTQAL